MTTLERPSAPAALTRPLHRVLRVPVDGVMTMVRGRSERCATGAARRVALAAALVAIVGVTQFTASGTGATGAVFTDPDIIADEWDGVGNAEGYEIARSTDSGGPYTTIGSTP